MGGRPSFPIIPQNERQVVVTGGNTGMYANEIELHNEDSCVSLICLNYRC